MNINFKNVKGDLIASEKQQGGITGKISVGNSFYRKHKKPIIITAILVAVGIIGFLSDLLNISSYIK
jgi:uncharacterized protein YdaL